MTDYLTKKIQKTPQFNYENKSFTRLTGDKCRKCKLYYYTAALVRKCNFRKDTIYNNKKVLSNKSNNRHVRSSCRKLWALYERL